MFEGPFENINLKNDHRYKSTQSAITFLWKKRVKWKTRMFRKTGRRFPLSPRDKELEASEEVGQQRPIKKERRNDPYVNEHGSFLLKSENNDVVFGLTASQKTGSKLEFR